MSFLRTPKSPPDHDSVTRATDAHEAQHTPLNERQAHVMEMGKRFGNQYVQRHVASLQRQAAPPDQAAPTTQPAVTTPTDPVPTQQDITTLVTQADANPRQTMLNMRQTYPNTWQTVFAQVIQAKQTATSEREALNLQSLMNPPDVDPADIEAIIESYQQRPIQLTLNDPNAAPNAPASVTVDLTLQTPYDISSRRNGTANTNVDNQYRSVRWAKGNATDTGAAMQTYLNGQARLNTLATVYFNTYQQQLQQGNDEAAARAAAEAAVSARAAELVSAAQIGVDCSGLVMRVMQEAIPDAFNWMLERRRASENSPNMSADHLISNYTNVRGITSNTSGGAGGGTNDLSVKWDDLATAVPGLAIQIGTGHIGGLIRNDVYTLGTLPADVSGERDNIVQNLFPADVPTLQTPGDAQTQLLNRQVRVIKYYHSIDATIPGEGNQRYVNSNLPGPHMAYAVFPITATSITDACYKIEAPNVAVNFTGLYVPRQRQIAQAPAAQPNNAGNGANGQNNGGGN